MKYWINKQGNKILISEMSEEYKNNVVNLLKKRLRIIEDIIGEIYMMDDNDSDMMFNFSSGFQASHVFEEGKRLKKLIKQLTK